MEIKGIIKCFSQSFLLLFFIVFLFVSCGSSRKVAKPDRTDFQSGVKELKIPNTTKSKVKEFLSGGIEKTIDTKGKSPAKLIKSAEKYMGTRHCMGGTTKKCIDCSGLIYASFHDIGLNIARTAEGQARYGRIISSREGLKKGDLVFFVNTYNTSRLITHSGIFIGDGNFIHTSSSKGVMVSNVFDKYYWGTKFAFGTRVF